MSKTMTVKNVLRKGGEICKDTAGGVSKGVTAYLAAGGPPTPAGIGVAGAVGGISQAASICTKIAIEEFSNRTLTQKEYQRVAIASYRIVNDIWERILNGESPRGDGFFDKSIDDRSAAEELLEGVLNAVRSEHEEKKSLYVERIFSSVAYRQDISREAANHFLRVGESLSFREIKLLALIGRSNEVGFNLKHVFDGPIQARRDCYVIRQQAKTLVGRELVKPTGQPPRRGAALDNLGKTLFELMGLSRLPLPELESLRDLLVARRRRKSQ